MAADKMPHEHTRSTAMLLNTFQAHFYDAQICLRTLKVAYIGIDNPLVLYVFEAYASMQLDTSKWNTFETHQPVPA